MADNTPQSDEQDKLTSQFMQLTGASTEKAHDFLASNRWDIEAAISLFYAAQDEPEEDDEPSPPSPSTSSDDEVVVAPGGRTLGGEGTASRRVADEPSSSKAPGGQRKKFATLGDLGSGASHGHGAGRASHDDDDDDDDEKQDFFAGGEKSGLAVQNPDDIKRKIIEKAKRAQPRQKDEKAAPSRFTGTARTLGGEHTPSEVIEDPNAKRPKSLETVSRVLHFWNNGFSVDDGPLYRSDDPVNRPILEAIRSGRAPLSIMNVQVGQEVDVNLQPHDSDYVQPKKKYTPFGGSGQRLGSPVPAMVSKAPAAVPAASPATSSGPTQPTVDDSVPTITLQIRLGDGSRLTARFNTTHTIGDVYGFVAAATPASNPPRSWVLMTTFPSKELSDKSAVLGEMGEFKRGGVVVQKWA